MRTKYYIGFALVAIVALGLIGSVYTGFFVKSNEISVLRMASFPTEDAVDQLEKMEPLRLYLERKLGMPVEITVTSDYSGVIEAMRSKHVEMAYLGPFSYVLAAKVANAEAMLGGIREATGDTSYNSIIVTRVDTGIETIEDLKGHSFAFLDPASTSGYLVPMNMLKGAGIDPETDFSEVVFAGSHAAVQLAVANGQVDAGADSIPSYDMMVERGLIDPEKQKIIWVSEPIPPSPISVRADIPQELKDRIRAAFLDPEAAKIVHAEGKYSGYAEVSDSDYDGLRDIAENLGLDLENM
jgi:phosphonate transport system substrate-binding protein